MSITLLTPLFLITGGNQFGQQQNQFGNQPGYNQPGQNFNPQQQQGGPGGAGAPPGNYPGQQNMPPQQGQYGGYPQQGAPGGAPTQGQPGQQFNPYQQQQRAMGRSPMGGPMPPQQGGPGGPPMGQPGQGGGQSGYGFN